MAKEKQVFNGKVHIRSVTTTQKDDSKEEVHKVVMTGTGDFGSAKIVISGSSAIPFLQGEDIKIEFSQSQKTLIPNK